MDENWLYPSWLSKAPLNQHIYHIFATEKASGTTRWMKTGKLATSTRRQKLHAVEPISWLIILYPDINDINLYQYHDDRMI